jgi:hypothetical protein
MKAGVDEAAFVGAVCHNKFIRQLQDDLSSIGHVYAISEMGLVRQQFA